LIGMTDSFLAQFTDATWRALDMPGGQEILDRMCAGEINIGDGLISLAVLSGDFERVNSPRPCTGRGDAS
jgi:hypothetical protein